MLPLRKQTNKQTSHGLLGNLRKWTVRTVFFYNEIVIENLLVSLFDYRLAFTNYAGWYPPPGFEHDPQQRRNPSDTLPTLRNAVVTCGSRPAQPAQCTPKDGPCLFNIEEDPCEYTNLVHEHEDVLNMLLQLLEKYKATMVPIRNKPYDFSANPKYHNGLWTAWCDEKPSKVCV